MPRIENQTGPRADPTRGVELIEQKLNSTWVRTHRSKLEQQWMKCVAYARGVQSETWEQFWATGGLDENLRSSSSRSRARFTANKIKPYIIRRRAQMVSAPPGWECQPNSPDFTDETAARMGQDILNHVYHDRQFFEKLSLAAWWTIVTGKSYIRPAWSTTSGVMQEIFFNPENPEELIPEEMIPPPVKIALRNVGLSEMVPTGDLELKVFSVFNLIEPPTGDDDYRPWAIELEYVHIEKLYDSYPDWKVDMAQRGSTNSGNQNWMTNLARVGGMLGPLAGRSSTYDDDELVLVRRLFIRPCKRYPKGRYVVEAGGVEFVDGPNPYMEFGVMDPHVCFPYATEGGGHYPGGLVEDLVKPQKALNDVRDARVENTRLMGNPKWLVHTKSGVDKITNRYGDIIKWSGPVPPSPVKIDPMDHAGEQINQTLTQDMMDLGFQQDVTQAKVPPNLRSGVAISLLQERDDAGITPVVRVWDRKVAQLGDYCLKIVCQMYPEGKILRVYGQDKQWDIREFKKGVVDGRVTVVTPEERRTPKSRTLEMQKIFEGLETGLIDATNPIARHEALRTMELSGGWEKVFSLQTANLRRARMENEIFGELGPQGPDGQYPAVEPWEDHSTHLAAHNEFRLSDRWEALPSEVRLVFDAHCQTHQDHADQMQRQQLELMEMARGAPGTKGRASQPSR